MADYYVADANRQQIGPIPEAEVRKLLAGGVLTLDSPAWRPGMEQWETLRAFSEFIDVPNAAPFNPYLPPVSRELSSSPEMNVPSAVRARALADEVLARDYQLDIFHCIGRAWNLVFSADFWSILGVTALSGFTFLASSACYANIVVGGPILGGLDLYFLKKIRREESTLNTAFSGFSLAFSQLFLVYLISSLLSGLGFMCCILPGIYLAVSWTFARALVIDRKLDFWDAMECSRKVVTRHWFLIFGLLIVCSLFMMLGFLALIIGFLITLPIYHAALMFAYEDIFNPAPRQLPLE